MWLSSEPRGSSADGRAEAETVRGGQRQVAFAFKTAVTPDLERGLRRAIVRRVEVGSTDEFLVTHLDASRVSLVQRILDNTFWVILVIVAASSVYTGLALRQGQASAERVLRDLGLSRRATARWRAELVTASTLVGGLSAAVTAAVCGAVVVYGETDSIVPGSGWLKLLPLLCIPPLTALIGAATAARRNEQESAWSLGFSTE